MDAVAAYDKVNSSGEEALIKSHALLVKRIAYHLLAKLPRHVLVDDLIQAGMLGLLEAVKHYDESKGAAFETYASIRIRGYMLDEVRDNDWVPRTVHKNARMIAETVKVLENKLGRGARDLEIAQALGISLSEYHDMLLDSTSCQLFGFDDLGITDDLLQDANNLACPLPHAKVMQDDLMARLADIVKGLPAKEGMVLSLYYEQDLNLKEIGEVLEVSESRVSQILTQATLRIKARLGK